MQTKVIQVGCSWGFIISKKLAKEFDLSLGDILNLNIKSDHIEISKQEKVRKGWKEAFSAYAQEGEDELLLPDFLDSESIDLA